MYSNKIWYDSQRRFWISRGVQFKQVHLETAVSSTAVNNPLTMPVEIVNPDLVVVRDGYLVKAQGEVLAEGMTLWKEFTLEQVETTERFKALMGEPLMHSELMTMTGAPSPLVDPR